MRKETREVIINKFFIFQFKTIAVDKTVYYMTRWYFFNFR